MKNLTLILTFLLLSNMQTMAAVPVQKAMVDILEYDLPPILSMVALVAMVFISIKWLLSLANPESKNEIDKLQEFLETRSELKKSKLEGDLLRTLESNGYILLDSVADANPKEETITSNFSLINTIIIGLLLTVIVILLI